MLCDYTFFQASVFPTDVFSMNQAVSPLTNMVTAPVSSNVVGFTPSAGQMGFSQSQSSMGFNQPSIQSVTGGSLAMTPQLVPANQGIITKMW